MADAATVLDVLMEIRELVNAQLRQRSRRPEAHGGRDVTAHQ
jgi:hypothetical protein